MSPGYFELDSLVQLGKTLDEVREYFNPGLELLGYLFTMSEPTINSATSLQILRQTYTGRVLREEFSSRSQRFVDLIARVDPALRKAPILGFNALEPIAQAAGIVLCGLGLGVTELADLIADPAKWEPRLRALEQAHPETAPAAQELRQLGRLPAKERQNRIAGLTSKLSLVRFHPNFRAIFGATTPAITWKDVVDQKFGRPDRFLQRQESGAPEVCAPVGSTTPF